MMQKRAKKTIHAIPIQKIIKNTSNARKTTVNLQECDKNIIKSLMHPINAIDNIRVNNYVKLEHFMLEGDVNE